MGNTAGLDGYAKSRPPPTGFETWTVQPAASLYTDWATLAAHYTYLLTYSMVQSPSSEANWFAASQEIPRISRNPKVHYRTHKRPPPVSILGQPNPVHIATSHLLKIHPNIIHPSTPRSPQWSLSLRFPHQDPIHPPLPLYSYKYCENSSSEDNHESKFHEFH